MLHCWRLRLRGARRDRLFLLLNRSVGSGGIIQHNIISWTYATCLVPHQLSLGRHLVGFPCSTPCSTRSVFRKMRDVTGRFIVDGTSHDLSVDGSFRGTSSAASFVVSHDVAGLSFISRFSRRVVGRRRPRVIGRVFSSCRTSSGSTSSTELFIVPWGVAVCDVIGRVTYAVVGTSKAEVFRYAAEFSLCLGT